MEVNLLLKLLIAHLLTDFVLQPSSWIEDRKLKKAKSKKLFLHILSTAAVAYILSGLYTNWIIPVVIFITHYAIDIAKSHSKDTFTNFIIDQVSHLIILITLWLTVDQKWFEIGPVVSEFLEQDNIWIIVIGYLFVSWPLGIIIGKGTQKWRNQIAKEEEKQKALELVVSDTTNDSGTEQTQKTISTEEQGLGLASAGKWIGICERILILTFVLMQQYTAIGFLMTAKSILRFSEKEANTQLKTEYILVGTLVSFAASAMIGVLIVIATK